MQSALIEWGGERWRRTSFSIGDNGGKVRSGADGLVFDGFALQLFAACSAVDAQGIGGFTMLEEIDTCRAKAMIGNRWRRATDLAVPRRWKLSAGGAA